MWPVLLILLAGVAAVAAAVGVTPVGKEWFDDAQTWIEGLLP